MRLTRFNGGMLFAVANKNTADILFLHVCQDVQHSAFEVIEFSSSAMRCWHVLKLRLLGGVNQEASRVSAFSPRALSSLTATMRGCQTQQLYILMFEQRLHMSEPLDMFQQVVFPRSFLHTPIQQMPVRVGANRSNGFSVFNLG